MEFPNTFLFQFKQEYLSYFFTIEHFENKIIAYLESEVGSGVSIPAFNKHAPCNKANMKSGEKSKHGGQCFVSWHSCIGLVL